MWIPRLLEPRLLRLAATRPVVVRDARSAEPAAQAESDPQAFLTRHPTPLIVDEVQYAPALFRHLKVVVDQERERFGQFLLTGSQPFLLMQGISESLAGGRLWCSWRASACWRSGRHCRL
jgi:hypothetical protein